MATKDELVAFGQANGVDVDSSMLKADVEAALSDAGYDPSTVGEDNVSEEPENTSAEDDSRLSRQSHFSTYRRVDQQREGEINPPPGPTTLEERGEPTEGAVKAFGSE